MSNTVQNPIYYSGPRLEKENRAPKAGWSGQAGQFVRLTDSGVVKCRAAATQIQGVLCKTQSSTVAATDIAIERITSTNTKVIMGMSATSAGGSDCRAASSLIGNTKNLAINSCVCSVALWSDTNGVLLIEDLMSNRDGQRYTTSNCPGYVLVSLTATALTAQGDGL